MPAGFIPVRPWLSLSIDNPVLLLAANAVGSFREPRQNLVGSCHGLLAPDELPLVAG